MEEIYIVKLKGLPPPSGTSQESLSKDAKNSFYYQDLTAEAIRGFSIISIFFGLTVLCLSVTNLCFSENPLALEPPLGITVWCAVAFLLLGLLGLYTAHKRRQDLSRSIFYVKVHFMLTFIVLLLAVTFVVLFAFGKCVILVPLNINTILLFSRSSRAHCQSVHWTEHFLLYHG